MSKKLPEDDLVYLLGILSACSRIRQFVRKCNSLQEFIEDDDQKIYNACLYQLSRIGEGSKKISDELKALYPKINWSGIISFRNHVIHEYENVNLETVFDIVSKKLPELELSVYLILSNELSRGRFFADEYHIAKESSYYKHIDFSQIEFD